MKKIYLIPFALIILFSSCKKDDASKDVETAIAKINYFNETFAILYEDGVISTEAPNKDEKSEYDQLKKIAAEYYDMMNKINSNIEEEKEKLKKGKKIDNYEATYLSIVKEKNEEISKATQLFEENLSKM